MLAVSPPPARGRVLRLDEAARRVADPGGRVRRAVDQLAAGAASDARALTERLLAGHIDLAAWQSSMASLVKSAHVAGGLAAIGGRGQATQADYGWLGRRIRDQYAFLRNFAAQLASGEQAPGGVALRRAEMYGEAARATHREMERRRALLGDAVEERNALGPADHCAGCVAETARGWVPIGSLVPVGSRPCLTRCRCVLRFRNAAAAVQDQAAQDAFGAQAARLTGSELLIVGVLKEPIVRAWGAQQRGNRAVVLTANRRGHFAASHPDVLPHERQLRAAVLDPDEVHRNKRDPDVALFYRRLAGDRYARVAVRMQAKAGRLKHSVLSFRIAKEAEIEKGRARRVWGRE